MKEETKGNRKRFKILSIDGGGIRGITPAQILSDLEEEIINLEGKNARLCDYFDLICGTSTGGIIAIGIALGLSAKEILDLYTEKADSIFPKIHIKTSLVRNKPFYDEKPIEVLLKEKFKRITPYGDTLLNDCRTRLCIPVYDLDKGAVHIIKAHCANGANDHNIPAVEVALSTSAAPVYFKPHSFSYQDQESKKGSTNRYFNLIDGGVLANNPALIGLTEAMYNLNQDLGNISLLSLGTGTFTFKDTQKNDNLGSRYWLQPNKEAGLPIYNLMASAQSLYIDNTINMMRNANKNFEYVRLQKTLDSNIPLDATDQNSLDHLQSYGHVLYTEHKESLLPFIQDKIK